MLSCSIIKVGTLLVKTRFTIFEIASALLLVLISYRIKIKFLKIFNSLSLK